MEEHNGQDHESQCCRHPGAANQVHQVENQYCACLDLIAAQSASRVKGNSATAADVEVLHDAWSPCLSLRVRARF